MSLAHHFADAATQNSMSLRSVREFISQQITFWCWDRKLSRQYQYIMKQRQSSSVHGENDA